MHQDASIHICNVAVLRPMHDPPRRRFSHGVGVGRMAGAGGCRQICHLEPNGMVENAVLKGHTQGLYAVDFSHANPNIVGTVRYVIT